MSVVTVTGHGRATAAWAGAAAEAEALSRAGLRGFGEGLTPPVYETAAAREDAQFPSARQHLPAPRGASALPLHAVEDKRVCPR